MLHCLRASVPAAALTLALLGVPATASAGIVEYTGLTAGQPAGIAAGPDGAVWFTEQGSPGAIGRIDTAGAITEFPAGVVPGFTANTQPADIVAGPDGALWFTEADATGAIGRFDPATQTVTEFTAGLTPNSEPAGITAGPDGNLWFTERARGVIGRITPAGDITEFTAGLSGASEPTDIALGEDGKLWFTEAGDPGRIGRIDPGTGAITEFSEGITPNGAPTSIVAAGSKLYFTLAAGSRIGKVKTDGAMSEVSSGISAGARPEGIAYGGDGALWYTDPVAPGRLGRLWPAGGAVSELTGGIAPGFSAGSAPAGITRGPDGNVWYAQRGLPAIARVTLPPRSDIGTPKPDAAGAVLLNAMIRPNSQPTTYFFEWGPDTGYGFRSATVSAGAGADPVAVELRVALHRDAHHHVRVTATNGSGTAVSSDKPFYVTADGEIVKEKPAEEGSSTIDVTPPPPPPASEPGTGADAPPAPPVLGETVTVHPRSGTIRIRRPGATRFVPLEAGASIPVGSRVDARAGKVVLRSARNATGRTQKGTFWGAIFQVRQSRRGRGMTSLALRGGNFARCSAKLASIASVPRRDAGRTRRVRSLWGRDRHGRFRTHGRDSVATVRGTVWRTTDRCDGTLTRVKHGKVLVRDVRRKRSVLLTAGRSYLARHAR